MILGNRRVKQKDIAKELESLKERVQHIITDILGYRKVSARWVLRMLTDEMKMQRKTTCAELPKHYEEEGEEFVQRIDMGMSPGYTIMTLRANVSRWNTGTRAPLLRGN
ncbi:histone-lysine N-methyltransferase SETMAR [Elysia marginata]|uniref:Histone-lysine N-methyltransferase SETMAR n=1 Tax=Elysia marginata TaxID=1093978 RepID=A0AAV4IGU3_9GAST|nr:histone-lysine N-methyltransferase SETMAR [Elysia marginata]